ncbi:serine/threonine-protein kinase [Roseimaritima sediminicola]|uniref:serine/threonine-protein kinase n=1 Tax=Roseimaritima sediminicola TaxID=2662066 RepID=UPI001298372B|nr:serine/threonine-protein kinase [Roseimaritima sediminicola]
MPFSHPSEIILSSTDPDLPDPIPPGLARYRNFREMARGGNALLRSCIDTVVGRTVALKTLLPEARRDRNERRRFLREARVTAQLQHPNTVPVYEIGDDPEEGLFFTMKRISGENFFEVLKRVARNDPATLEMYPVRERIEIVINICQALAYAHLRGVIHRDVKPENIWVGNFGEAILLDWGVAKVWGHADDNPAIGSSVLVGTEHKNQAQTNQLQTLTNQGMRPGTPLYMSPEQVQGNRTIDERTDIFSVGVVLYEMLTLCEPFKGRTIDETFDNIRRKDLPPPSQRGTRDDVPPEVDEVVLKAIAKNPNDRYTHMRDLVEALQGVTAKL